MTRKKKVTIGGVPRRPRVESEVKRARIIDFTYQYWKEKGYGPSVREISDYIGLGTTSTQAHIDVLCKRGDLLKEDGLSRTIRVPNEYAGADQVGAA